ncbi:MAG: RNA ligase family protein [Marinovum sp.]|nr:RNA ligase family protein [Marinovum sp.]
MQKYGRTYHFPFSPGVQSDDKIIPSLERFDGQDVVVTEKMDGENTTIHPGGCHPRSPDARYHPSRDWMMAFAATISHQLESDERIIGEYLYARHSIAYDALSSYFLGFAWVKADVFQPWDATRSRLDALGIQSVPELCQGTFDLSSIQDLAGSLDTAKQEGFVMRLTGAFPEAEMGVSVAKWVRAGHVQSQAHWTKSPLIANGLA